MIGRIMIRVRNLWILVITALVVLGVVAALLIFGSHPKSVIPQKGVFVLEMGIKEAQDNVGNFY